MGTWQGPTLVYEDDIALEKYTYSGDELNGETLHNLIFPDILPGNNYMIEINDKVEFFFSRHIDFSFINQNNQKDLSDKIYKYIINGRVDFDLEDNYTEQNGIYENNKVYINGRVKGFNTCFKVGFYNIDKTTIEIISLNENQNIGFIIDNNKINR